MTCQEFLARHAEYMDELLPASEVARWEAHISACASCARYDRVVRRGVELLRAAPQIEPSSDFFPRLQHRIYNLEDEMRGGHRGPGAGAMASLAIAGVLAFLAWSPLLRLDQMFAPAAAVDTGVAATGVANAVTTAEPASFTAGEPAARIAVEPPSAPALGEGRSQSATGTQWRRIEFDGPSALRPLEVAGEWGTPRPRSGAAGWGSFEFVDDFDAPFDLLPTIPPSRESLWWFGSSTQPQHGPIGRGLVQQRANLYPPMLTGARVDGPASVQVHRATDSIPTRH